MNSEPKPIFHTSLEAQTLISHLQGIEEGATITWEQMGTLIGGDAQEHRGAVMTARRALLRDKGMVFGAIKGIGLKHLAPNEVVDSESTTPTRVRRFVRRSQNRLRTVNPDTLNQESKKTHMITSAGLAVIALCTSPTSLKKVEQLVISNRQTPDIEATLKLFGGK